MQNERERERVLRPKKRKKTRTRARIAKNNANGSAIFLLANVIIPGPRNW